MYVLVDTFNGRTYSTHRSLRTALAAQRKLGKDIKRKLGQGSYLPTEIAVTDPQGPGVRVGSNTYYGVGRLRPMNEQEYKELLNEEARPRP